MLNRIKAQSVLVILQNAYDKGSLAQGYSYARWLKEMETSRVGQRLAQVFQDVRAARYVNTTPLLGCGPDAKLPVCPAHLRRAFNRVRPQIVLACGAEAEKAALELWRGDIVSIPHPAHRLLTNELLADAAQIIGWRLTQRENTAQTIPKKYLFAYHHVMMRIALRQRRGFYEVYPLMGHHASRGVV
jgi:hypothetical protein